MRRVEAAMRITTVALCSLAMLGLAACDRRAAQPTSQSPATASPAAEAFKPVATVKQVMLGIVVPASNAVFAVAGEAPADDAGWQAVEASAMAVAESGNLLLMKPRAMDDQDWRQF